MTSLYYPENRLLTRFLLAVHPRTQIGRSEKLLHTIRTLLVPLPAEKLRDLTNAATHNLHIRLKLAEAAKERPAPSLASAARNTPSKLTGLPPSGFSIEKTPEAAPTPAGVSEKSGNAHAR